MIQSLSDWTENEFRPALGALGALTIQALDTLPLPMLVVGFLALLAMLQWPQPKTPHLLPQYSPSFYEKTRLSPTPFSPQPLPLPQSRSMFNPSFSLSPPQSAAQTPYSSNSPQYFAVIHDPHSASSSPRSTVLHASESGSLTPPRQGRVERGGGASRRGSKRDHWRKGSLGVVEELPEDKLQV